MHCLQCILLAEGWDEKGISKTCHSARFGKPRLRVTDCELAQQSVSSVCHEKKKMLGDTGTFPRNSEADGEGAGVPSAC